jgi:O-antigen/teichoic acid export membrane protein
MRDLRAVGRRDWRFASVQVGLLVNTSIEIWIAGIFLASAATSMMGAAQRLAALVILPMTALQVVLAPLIARLTKSDSHVELESMLRSGATISAGVTAVMWLPLVLAPELVLRLVFGPGFEDAAVPLMLVATGACVSSLAGLAGLTLSMAHHEGVSAVVQWSAVAARAVVGSAAALAFGLNALALSAAVISGATFVALWWRARQILGVNTALTLHPDFAVVRRPTGVTE